MLSVFVFPQKRAIAFWPCPAREFSRIFCVFCARLRRVLRKVSSVHGQGLGAGVGVGAFSSNYSKNPSLTKMLSRSSVVVARNTLSRTAISVRKKIIAKIINKNLGSN